MVVSAGCPRQKAVMSLEDGIAVVVVVKVCVCVGGDKETHMTLIGSVPLPFHDPVEGRV